MTTTPFAGAGGVSVGLSPAFVEDGSELTLLSRTVDVDIDRLSLAVVEEVVDEVRDSDPDSEKLLEEAVDAADEPEVGTSLLVEADCEPGSVERAVSLEVEPGIIPAAELPGVDSVAGEPDEVSGTDAEFSPGDEEG